MIDLRLVMEMRRKACPAAGEVDYLTAEKTAVRMGIPIVECPFGTFCLSIKLIGIDDCREKQIAWGNQARSEITIIVSACIVDLRRSFRAEKLNVSIFRNTENSRLLLYPASALSTVAVPVP